MKTISFKQLAAIKRVAQNVSPLVQKKNKIATQINALNKEYNDLMMEIEGHETGVIRLTGYTSESLVRRVKEEGKTTYHYVPIPEALRFNETTKTFDLLLDEVIPLTEASPSEIDVKSEGALFDDADGTLNTGFEDSIPQIPQEVEDDIVARSEQMQSDSINLNSLI